MGTEEAEDRPDDERIDHQALPDAHGTDEESVKLLRQVAVFGNPAQRRLESCADAASGDARSKRKEPDPECHHGESRADDLGDLTPIAAGRHIGRNRLDPVRQRNRAVDGREEEDAREVN